MLVGIRQRTSARIAYVSIRQHTIACAHWHTSAYVSPFSIRQHTSAYVSIPLRVPVGVDVVLEEKVIGVGFRV